MLNVCRFPIVDTWFAQVPHFGGGEDKAGYRARNDSAGAVEEMECVARSGFLKYAPVAVLLEPDLYDANNQQGWWDDEHWQRGPNNRARGAASGESSHGQFVPPYETARKWAGAIQSLGGIPMIYLQTGFRSQDYADRFPDHMLYQRPDAPYLNDKGEQQYRDKEKKQPRKMGYDYTSPGFQRHVREVWENLRLAGVQGREVRLPRPAVHRLARRRDGRRLRHHGHALPHHLPPRPRGAGAGLLPARAGAGPRLGRDARPRHLAADRGGHRQDGPGDGLAASACGGTRTGSS